jgi:uncharacterized protein (TIGR02271 family)
MTDDRHDRFYDDQDEPVVGEQDAHIEGYDKTSLDERRHEALLDGRDHRTLELRAEELQVHKREVEQGRVRIDKRIESVPFAEDIDVEMDVVEVQRVPRFEEFDAPPESRYEGDTLIIPVIEEVLVVTRRYRVIEEVHVTTRREVRTERVEDELRHEVLTVDVIDTEPDSGTDRLT